MRLLFAKHIKLASEDETMLWASLHITIKLACTL